MITKAVITTKEAWKYCGTRLRFEQLKSDYPRLIVPFSEGKPTGPGKRGRTEYLVSVLDTALQAAQMERKYAK